MLSQMAQPRAPGSGPVSYAPPPALQSALSQLQDQLTQQAAAVQQPRLYSAGEIKQMLSEALGTDHSTGEPMALADHHAQTIDIMGMLYDHIKEEDLLHEPVQQLLHRLQVPMIRVALQEDEFFEDSDHPARKLFNTIADAGELWLEDQPEESPTFQKMQVAVDKILDEYNDDLNVFKDLLSDLDKHIHTLSRKAKLAEKRQVEKLRGQERLELARNKARTEMERLIEQYSPPRFVESVLEHPWTDFLALTSLRYGEEGDQWKEALSVAKTLIYSVRKELSEDLKSKLRTKIQWLKDKLSQGLSQVGYFEQDIKIVVGNLETCHRWSLAPQRRPAEAEEVVKAAPPESAQPEKPAEEASPAEEPATEATPEPSAAESEAPDVAEDTPEPEAAAAEAPEPEAAAEPEATAEAEESAEPEETEAAAANEEPADDEEDIPESAVAAIVAGEAANEEPPPELNQPVPKSQAKEDEEDQQKTAARKALPDLNTEQKAQLAKIRLVAFGTWFEMENSDGDWVKRKLSWYSPVTGRCLFVNNRGAMVDEMNLHELAIAMTDGKAREFEVSQKPIIDRAFDAIFSKLKGLVSKVSPA